MAQLSSVSIVAGVAVVGSLLAVAVPTFVQNLHASRLAEPIHGLSTIARRASHLAAGRGADWAYPESAPRTPAEVPRGVVRRDPPGTWDHPTWRRLDFQPEGPHAYAFTFESRNGATAAEFDAIANGDLDGDGSLSEFRVRGTMAAGRLPSVEPMVIHREVE